MRSGFEDFMHLPAPALTAKTPFAVAAKTADIGWVVGLWPQGSGSKNRNETVPRRAFFLDTQLLASWHLYRIGHEPTRRLIV